MQKGANPCLQDQFVAWGGAGKVVVAQWQASSSGIINIESNSIEEIIVSGTPQVLVGNASYLAFVTDTNQIYVIDRSNGNTVRLLSDHAVGATPITDLSLDGPILAWSDDTTGGFYTISYANLSTYSAQTQDYIWLPLTSARSDVTTRYPTVVGNRVYWLVMSADPLAPSEIWKDEVNLN